MPISKQEADLDAQFTAQYASTPGTPGKTWKDITPPVSANQAAGYGAGSGLLMGLGPQALAGLKTGAGFLGDYPSQLEKEKENFQQAWEQHPAAYGAGYTGGTIANMVGTEGLGTALKGALGARVVAGASPFASGVEQVVGKTAGQVGNIVDKTKAATSILPSNTGKALRTGNALYQWDTNTPEGSKMINLPYGDNPKSPVNATPLSQNEAPGPFASLANFLAQSAESANPDVQSAATQAQQAVDPNDPDAQRKIAMLLQGTPAGRAVGNSDSSLNEV